jgi:NTE family protein
MRGISLTILFFFFLITHTFAQSVSVVLSGGGAKGLAHVGVLKALEENEIPIDNLVGTSMGGIVAGCYAAGMSPDQIEDVVTSDAFLRWVNGKLEDGYNYYYNKSDETPSAVKLNLSLDSTFNVIFNSSIANDLALNFALAETFAQSSSISKNNFDSLFVPLRIVTSDIFTQSEVILSKGVLSDALRATQSVPFFYNPIRVDGKYLFDGGVYNNFPISVATESFHPDVVIGSNVSSKVFDDYPFDEDEKLISRSLLYMLLDKSDPALVPATGIYIQPNLKGYSTLEFAKVKALIDSGYMQTMRQMPELKLKIAARRDCESVAAARNKFNNRAAPFLIEEIHFVGFNNSQKRYLNRFFGGGKHPMYFSNIKADYYSLVSDDYFKNVFPNFIFDPLTGKYQFQLSRRPQNNFQVDFGGVIATRSISNIFLGMNYYSFNRVLTHGSANFYAGNFYKSVQLKARVDFPSFGQFYLEPETTFNSWDFLEGNDIIVKKYPPTVLNRIDRKGSMSVGVPVSKKYRAAFHVAYINNTDNYINGNLFTSTDTLDIFKLSGARFGVSMTTNLLNRKQYASQGYAYSFSLNWFDLHETYTPGSTAVQPAVEGKARKWWQAKVSVQQYFKKGIYSSGYSVEGVFSNQPLFTSYQSTIINAPAFNPLQDSRTLLLERFRALNYVAGGWQNVFSVRKNLDFRLEGYLFKPFQSLQEGEDQSPELNSDLAKISIAAMASIVLNSSVGPISLSVNYYDDHQNQLGVLLHVGFLLFNKTSLE